MAWSVMPALQRRTVPMTATKLDRLLFFASKRQSSKRYTCTIGPKKPKHALGVVLFTLPSGYNWKSIVSEIGGRKRLLCNIDGKLSLAWYDGQAFEGTHPTEGSLPASR